MSANSSIFERFASLNSSRKSSMSKLDFTGQHYTSKISEFLQHFILFYFFMIRHYRYSKATWPMARIAHSIAAVAQSLRTHFFGYQR